MHTIPNGERLLTELDHARLNKLLVDALPTDLYDTLSSIDTVPSRAIPPDTVTMYSQVLIEDLDTGQRQKLTLCYPADAEPQQGFISVLSPVGASLIGQRVGATARWRTPDGNAGAAVLVELLFQPEASGDHTL